MQSCINLVIKFDRAAVNGPLPILMRVTVISNLARWEFPYIMKKKANGIISRRAFSFMAVASRFRSSMSGPRVRDLYRQKQRTHTHICVVCTLV